VGRRLLHSGRKTEVISGVEWASRAGGVFCLVRDVEARYVKSWAVDGDNWPRFPVHLDDYDFNTLFEAATSYQSVALAVG
jgi:hypothetical protein